MESFPSLAFVFIHPLCPCFEGSVSFPLGFPRISFSYVRQLPAIMAAVAPYQSPGPFRYPLNASFVQWWSSVSPLPFTYVFSVVLCCLTWLGRFIFVRSRFWFVSWRLVFLTFFVNMYSRGNVRYTYEKCITHNRLAQFSRYNRVGLTRLILNKTCQSLLY